jgi:hypothetical protein
MNDSTAYSLVMVAIPFIVALILYGVLRGREMDSLIAGCVSVVAGLLVSAIITGIVLVRVVT